MSESKPPRAPASWASKTTAGLLAAVITAGGGYAKSLQDDVAQLRRDMTEVRERSARLEAQVEALVYVIRNQLGPQASRHP